MTTSKGETPEDRLPFKHVTSDSFFIAVDESQTTDLFWALRSGGDGTFEMVTCESAPE